MTREYLKEQMNHISYINGIEFETFYLRYSDQNITSNNWGNIEKLEKILDETEKSRDCIQGILPIKLLVLIEKGNVHCWIANPLWDPINYEDEDSHIYVNVPLVGKHWFVDPEDWWDIDNRGKWVQQSPRF